MNIAIDAADRGRRKHQRIAFAAGRGHHHHDLAHAGDLGRHRVHQHRRGIGRLAAGDVDAHAVERRHLLAQPGAVVVDVAPGLADLALVVRADAPRRVHQRLALRLSEPGERGLHLGAADLQRGHPLVPARGRSAGVLQHRGVAAPPHVGQDLGHDPLDALVLRRSRTPAAAAELRLEIGAAGIEQIKLQHPPLPVLPRRRTRPAWAGSASRLSLSAAWFTTRRALIGMISSTATRWFALSVLPVLTRSTMASASPTSGASSIEPYSLIRSTCTPLAAKCSRAVCTILGRHAQARALAHRRGVVEVVAHRDHHAAARDVQVQRLVQPFAAVLVEHVLARHAQVGRAVSARRSARRRRAR